ncbi:MAG: LCP family protein [Ruminococcus sp.]|nr:LCP family protein [Ruminococcus sp.]
MTNKKRPDNADRYVDISSGNQVKKVYKKKGRSLRIVSIVLSILLIIGGAVPIALYLGVGMANYSALDDVSIKETVASTDGEGNISTSFTDSDLLSDPKVLNIMLFGEDKHSKKSFGRSDSMIMLSIDNRSKAIKITSFQRDTYLYIPGHGYDKMTHAYPLGGPSLAIRTVEANFGIKIDRYATVDFNSFKKIIDILGGIDMELTDDEIEYINYQMYKNNQTTERYTITDDAGIVHLNGQEALWYARNRGLSTGEDGNEIGLDGDDWDRTDRQRKLMDTLFKSMKNASFDKIISIATQVGPYVTTNLKKDEITGLLTRCLTYLKYDMKKYNIPQKGLWSYYDADGVSYIQINDMDKCRKKFIKFVFGDAVADSFLSSSKASD